MITDFLRGANCFFQGFTLITKPGIRRFVAIPLLINILVFTGLFFLSKHYFTELNTWFAHYLPTWLQWLSTVLWLLFFVSFFLLMIYTFTLIANIISAPFNNALAEQVEEHITHKTLPSRTTLENIKDIPRVMGRQLGIIGFYLPRAFALLLLFLVPIVQLIAPLMWFIFHAWFMTLLYIDYPSDNHRISIDEVKTRLRRRQALTLGFGASVMFTTMIPIVNFFTIPAAVAGATLLWLQI